MCHNTDDQVYLDLYRRLKVSNFASRVWVRTPMEHINKAIEIYTKHKEAKS